MPLKGKNIVLGVTGGIAAYKACELTSRLRKAGAQVYVIMTKNACQFVAPLTFETLSNHPVVTDTFARPDTWEVEHIALAKRADVFVIPSFPNPFPAPDALRRAIRDSKGIYPFGGGLRGGGKPNGFAGLALPDCRRFKSKI